jgi:hypothetical protein
VLIRRSAVPWWNRGRAKDQREKPLKFADDSYGSNNIIIIIIIIVITISTNIIVVNIMIIIIIITPTSTTAAGATNASVGEQRNDTTT